MTHLPQRPVFALHLPDVLRTALEGRLEESIERRSFLPLDGSHAHNTFALKQEADGGYATASLGQKLLDAASCTCRVIRDAFAEVSIVRWCVAANGSITWRTHTIMATFPPAATASKVTALPVPSAIFCAWRQLRI